MLGEARSFIFDCASGGHRWLTFVGPTEVGKTHLIKKITEFFKLYDYNLPKKFNYPDILYYTWSSLIDKLFSKEITLDKIFNCGLLVIEDFLSYRSFDNARGNPALDISYEILNRRLKKPLLIDTNKSIKDIQNLDSRIASRLYRNDSVVYEISKETPGYLTR